MGIATATSGEAAGGASVQPLLTLTADAMEAVNRLILSRAGSDVELIPEISNYLVTAGGKRLRPMLTIASASIFGYQGDHHVKLATAVEFMHTATLLHDDVVDESDMRRARATARRIWGNQASVLVGDFLLGQAFRLMVDVGSLDALDVLSTAASVIAEGEVWQLSASRSMETTQKDYEGVIRAKTAALFAAAAEVGPIIAGADDGQREAFRAYGDALGMAFQLVDDALDYGGSAASLGKNVGDDFREGKVTLPVILAYRDGDEEAKAFWRKAIEDGENDDAALARAVDYLDRAGAVERTVEEARLHGDRARQALAALPAGPWREALDEVVTFCIARVV